MNKEDCKLIAIKMKSDSKWMCYIQALPGIYVQVENIEDAPEKLGKHVATWMKHQVKTGNVHKEIMKVVNPI